jgi:hypothetical protein
VLLMCAPEADGSFSVMAHIRLSLLLDETLWAVEYMSDLLTTE